jgi:dCMP deaminase
MNIEKEAKYLELAVHFAKLFSKDQSTQVGAMFLHPTEFTILSAGYNGIPRGCEDTAPERHERPTKYDYFEHAERNAIYNAVRDEFRDGRIICTAPLSVDDIRALVSVGIREIATDNLPDSKAARALLDEAGVSVRILPPLEVAPGQVGFYKPGSKRHFVTATCPEPTAGEEVEEYSAVQDAIFKIARTKLEGSTMVVGPLMPCACCARASAAVGAKRVISYEPTAEQNDRWGSSFTQARKALASRGVELLEIQAP